MIAALAFLLSYEIIEDDCDDSSEDCQPNHQPQALINREIINKAHHKGTSSSKEKMQSNSQLAFRSMKKQQLPLSGKNATNYYSPLKHLKDAQGFTEKLFSHLQHRNELVETKSMMVKVISQIAGLYGLVLPDIQEYVHIFCLEPKIASLVGFEMEASEVKHTAETKAEKLERLKMYSLKGDGMKELVVRKRYPNSLPNNEKDGLYNRNIPPYDLSAAEKEMAYPLNWIILGGEWESLLDINALWEAEQPLAPDNYPTFVRNRVHLLGLKDGEERKKLACIFSYITHLIKFKDRHSLMVNSAKHHRFPSIIHKRFTTMFTPSDDFKLPDEKKNLLIHYALVLTLFVDNFDTEPTDIAKDLRVSLIPLCFHFRNLGCKMHRHQRTVKYELRLPLEFPRPNPKKRRR